MAIDFVRANGYEGVTAYDDAVVANYAFRGKSGVVKGVYNEFDCNTSPASIWANSKIEIQSGCGIAYGRQFYIRNGTTEEISLTLPSSGSYYYIIYAKIDCVNSIDEKVTFHAVYGTSSYPAVPSSNNLLEVPNGIAYIHLYNLLLTASGSAATINKKYEYLGVGKQYELLFDGNVESVNTSISFPEMFRPGNPLDWQKTFKYLEIEAGPSIAVIGNRKGRFPIYENKIICQGVSIVQPGESAFPGYEDGATAIENTEIVKSVSGASVLLSVGKSSVIEYKGNTVSHTIATGSTLFDARIQKIYGIY